ncbi:hypothetical protein [Priestia megaterium]|uniref:Uncharacterized protein n=1 Tax=Priestia megaterium TaxID=1404 RepID=A0A6M6E729_PRIMG|nr:hypothetical protein [Priestia megaterium]QJX80347.1 hypothetical protein FDZ14_30125 [Priestia megaterium]
MRTEDLKEIITEKFTHQITKKRENLHKKNEDKFNSPDSQEESNAAFNKAVLEECEFLSNELYEQKLIPQVNIFKVVGPYIYTYGSVSGEKNTLTEQEKLILFIERVREHSDGKFSLFSDRMANKEE